MANANSTTIKTANVERLRYEFFSRLMLDGTRWLGRFENLPDKCITWGGYIRPDGYGQLEVNRIRYRTHRLSYFLHTGIWPETDIFVCHTCDNPSCVNPRHHFLGTNQENIVDKVAKVRQQRGSNVPQSILREPDVVAIMKRLAAGEPAKPIAREYGVHFVTISDIKCGRGWSHLAGVDGNPTVDAMVNAKPLSKHVAKLDETMAREIKRRLASGEKPGPIALSFNVSRGAVSHIKQGRTWSHI